MKYDVCDLRSDGSSTPGVEARAKWITGIDVSHHNGAVDWKTVAKGGTRFAFVKTTEGRDWADPSFTGHFAALKAAGIPRGAYHFYETDDDPLAQAQWFIEHVSLEAGDLPPVVDIEKITPPTPPTLTSDFGTFLDALYAHYGVEAIIYTGERFWDHALKEHFPKHPLWIAAYDVAAPTIPQGWKAWTFWQFTQDETLSGLKTPVDCSYFQGDWAELQSILLPTKKP